MCGFSITQKRFLPVPIGPTPICITFLYQTRFSQDIPSSVQRDRKLHWRCQALRHLFFCIACEHCYRKKIYYNKFVTTSKLTQRTN